MKTNHITNLLALAALVATQDTAEDKYNAVCPPSRVPQTSASDKYACGYSGQTTSAIGGPQHADSPEACDSLCHDSSHCEGSVWLYSLSLCQLFSLRDPDETQMVPGFVFIRRNLVGDILFKGGLDIEDITREISILANHILDNIDED